MAVPQAEIGRLAFQSLWSLINASPGGDYEVKTNLLVRQTTAPVRAASESRPGKQIMVKEISHNA